MKDNRNDRTIERNYTQKWRFLIAEYELVKAKKHPKFRFVQDFYPFHGVSRQTFAKCYNRHRESGDANALLPAKRGPRWKSRRTPPFINAARPRTAPQGRQPLRDLRYPPSPNWATTRRSPRHLRHLRTPRPQPLDAPDAAVQAQDQSRRAPGELGHLDCHYLGKDQIVGSKSRRYLVAMLDAPRAAGLGGGGGRPEEPERDVRGAQEPSTC